MNRINNNNLLLNLLTGKRQDAQPLNSSIINRNNVVITNEESSEEEVNLKYIIDNKPKSKIVREFMKTNLQCIKSEGETLFDLEL
jgi:hypothetical protein